MMSFLSSSFFIPAKTILVPGTYFLGFSRYSFNVSSFHCTPFDFIPGVYEKSDLPVELFIWINTLQKNSSHCSTLSHSSQLTILLPDVLPNTLCKFGPILFFPPGFVVWHWEHSFVNIFFPFSTSPILFLFFLLRNCHSLVRLLST